MKRRRRNLIQEVDTGYGIFPAWRQQLSLIWPVRGHPVSTRWTTRAIESVLPVGASVIDIGSGIGRLVKHLREKGFDIVGIDGTPGIEQISGGLVLECDLTGDCSRFKDYADWGLFREVGEHVPVEHEQELINNVSSIPREGLIFSWALPNRKGFGHCNCRPVEYVIDEFSKRGWKLDESLTKLVGARRSRGRSMTVLRRT